MRRTVTIVMVLVAVAAIGATMAYGGRGEGRGGGGRFMGQLTEEQRAEIHQMVTEMREAGATREDIRTAVREKLEGWGIEVREHPHRGEGRGEGRGRGHFMGQLTEEQRAEIHQMVTEMREAGASHEDIRTAVHEMLREFGIELPDECSGQGARIESLIGPADGESATWGEIKGEFR